MNKPKKELKNSVLFPESTLEMQSKENVMLEWKIENYRELKQNVTYYTESTDRNFEGSLELLRRKETLRLTMKTPSTKKEVFFNICNRDGSVAKETAICEETNKGCYVAHFNDETICNPESAFLKDGELLIQCTYLDDCIRIKVLNYGHVRYPTDVEELAQNFKNLYEKNYATDFTLKAQGERYRVHKLVLIARCNFFLEFFKKNGIDQTECEVNATSNILQHVIMFVYTGRLTTDLEVSSLEEVLLVARNLGMRSLEKLCLEVLEAYRRNSVSDNS